MKKYLFILGLVGTALLTACSSDDLMTVLSPEEERALIVEASQDSDVPITLGSVASARSGMTRTPIESYGNFNTPTGANAPCLGVFCLASGKQASAPSSASGNWDDDDALATWLNNVPAKVATGVVTFLDPTTLDQETPTSRVLYYPYGNWYYYNFYAYYPRITDAEISVGSNSVIVNYEIDGSQDIIWGKTTAPAEAYCAQYFRDNPTTIPQFDEFKHKLVQFRFFVKAADALALAALQSSSAQVTDMYIANAYYNLRLVVANKLNPEFNGTLSKFDDSMTELGIKENGIDENRFRDVNGDHVVDNPLDINVSTVDVTSDAPVGYIMLAPPSVGGDNFKYQLDFNLEYSGGSKLVSFALNPPDGGFVEGKTYNIIIDIYSSVLD